jgi:hypothetical protein
MALMKFVAMSGFGAAGGLLIAACGAPPRDAPDLKTHRERAGAIKLGNSMTAPPNEQFRTLDEYLAHLERTQGPVDGSWYRQIRPGVYELQTGNLRVLGDGAEPKRLFTRQELELEFGFRR